MENENKNVELNNQNEVQNLETKANESVQGEMNAQVTNNEVTQVTPVQITAPADSAVPEAPTAPAQPVPAPAVEPVVAPAVQMTVEQPNNVQPNIPQDITQISSGLQSKENIEIKKSNTGVKVIIAILVLLLVVLCGLGGAYVYVHTDEYIVGSSIKTFNNVKEKYFPKLKYNLESNGKMTTEGTMNFKLDSSDKDGDKIADILKDLKVDYKYVLSDKNMLMNLMLSKTNEELAGAKLIYKDNKAYLLLNKIFDKYIDLEIEEEIEVPTDEEINTLIEVAYNSFSDKFFEKELVKTTESIVIDGANVEVASNKIEYTEEEIYILLNEVLKDIKADKTANSAAKKLYSDFEKFNFDDYLEELDKEYMETYSYIIYTDKLTSKALGVDFIVEYYEEIYKDFEDCEHLDDMDEYFDCMYEPTLEKTNDKISYRTGEKEIIEVFEEEEKESSYVISKEDNKTIITIEDYYKYSDPSTAKIEIYSKGDTINVLFETKEDEETVKLNYDLVVTEVKANSEYKMTANIIMNYEDKEYEESMRFEVNLNGTIKNSGEVKEEITDAIKMEDLTDEDKETIQNNLEGIFEKLGILDEEEPEESDIGPEEILPQNEVVAE